MNPPDQTSVYEPPQPQRGLTAEERIAAAEQQIAENPEDQPLPPSMWRRFVQHAGIRHVLAQANGYPVVIKQFLQFCLILIYPAWVFAIVAGAVFYFVFWVLFWPVRAWMKTNKPEDYEKARRI
ncbi:hypothetical protein [Antrihabitans cavernicola]|uniref:Uncharacterized protein n=1 Tax=Antrihabitans cavernicola TaxID=2495913 RepID=A0A5A7S3P5_9NOCA|nr:hypothetical protein [Spelaeibacter cavernicola]KAA0020021.1 hypothetical protein FOY51_21905 [Spelaeibacter cavernicola]